MARAGAGACPAAALLFCLAVWCVAMRAGASDSAVLHQQISNVARNLASGLFLVAGVLRLVQWRLTGAPVAARSAVALLMLGTAVPGAALIGPLLHESAAVAQNAPSARALFLVPVFALLLPGGRWPRQTVSRPIPGTLLVRTALATGAWLGFLLPAHYLLGASQRHAAVLAITAAAACAWLALAARRLADSDGGTCRWSATAALLLGVAEMVRGWAAGGASAPDGIAPGIELAAVVVILCVAAGELREAYRGDGTNALDLSHALVRLKGHLAELERAQRERLHDARSAVAGVMGASELLGTPLPTTDADLLRRLVVEELHRLQAVLDTTTPEPIVPFELTDALIPIIAVHQLSGSPIQVDLGALRVLGRPKATATVVDNLLRNARTHAPGARVSVRAVYRGTIVTVVVEDDGPGIPAAECERVLQPGVRGSAAIGPGEGLGLHSAATAMTAQGGTLHVGPRQGGGTRAAFTMLLADDAAANVLAS